MGDLQYWPAVAANGGSATDFRSSLAAPQPPSPDPSVIEAENLRVGEEATRWILLRIQPTVVSESRRKDVVEYVQKLVKGYLGSEVFPFGSVPLKTYLPDGDIDLTAISYPNMEDPLANEVHSVLEVEEKNKDAEFEVKDVQFIHAEVKLVKCIVQNIVVDISFNQIGGLSTLCFLEKVDRKIGKDHIFKRSIILVKAWCYYESRILGAHHGLISTYALETLVLHVFHLFHKSLDGPLAVLYRFLDYYSKFDWDNYCVSLPGPVSLSSVPEVVAEPSEICGTDLLFSDEFIKECLDLFSFSLRGFENSPRVFSQKYLNIVDPLKQYNNLGRSVSKGNFYRIRSAFAYGARKLGRVLLQPVDRVASEVRLFFTNTLDRHGSGERPDVQGAAPISIDGRYKELNGFNTTSHIVPEISNEEILGTGAAFQDFNGSITEEINKINISALDREQYAERQCTIKSSDQHVDLNSEQECSQMESLSLSMDGVSGKRLYGDARDLASDRNSDSMPADDNCKASPSGKAYHEPHPFKQASNGIEDVIIDCVNPESSPVRKEALSTGRGLDEVISDEIDSTSKASYCRKNTRSASSGSVVGSPVTTSNVLEDSRSFDSLTIENGHNSSPKSGNLSDLTGNEQLHLISFDYALRFQGIMMSSYYVPTQPMSPTHYRSKHSWNSFPQQNLFTHIGANRLMSGPPFSPTGSYLVNSSAISGAYAAKDIQRTRGTGTYFPNTNSRSYRERQSPVKGKSQIPTNMPRSYYNGRSELSQERSMSEVGRVEPSPNPQAPIFNGSTHGKPAHFDAPLSRPVSRVVSDGNGFVHSLERKLKFGSLGALPLEGSSSERANNHDFETSFSQISEPVSPAPTAQRHHVNSKVERHIEPYQLKDDGDFPPLTG